MLKNLVSKIIGILKSMSLKQTIGVVIGVIILVTLLSASWRFDYAGGSHRIIPTAVDTDFWGNFQVYFKTSALTQNQEEDYYYVHKRNRQVAEQIRDAILKNQEIMVYYDRYIGFKGPTSPKSSPIVRVEYIDGTGQQ